MSEPAVLYEVRDGVASVTLNQPERLNPLSAPVVQGLLDALSRVRDDNSVRAVLLTGRGRGFCVGADLADLAQREGDQESLGRQVGRLMEEGGNPVIAGLRELEVPVVCAVNGPAAGGGVGLALAADLTIAARSAYFYLPFVPALGLVPDMGTTWSLPRAVGRHRALGLALTGEKLPAERAADWGLIWECVDDAELPARAATIAARLAALPSGAATELRTLFAGAERNTLREQLALERGRQEELIDGPSFAEGLAAFHQKRKPSFRPRGS